MNEQILGIVERYLGRARFSGASNVMLQCPFHTVKSGLQFSVNVDLGLFHCFSCGVSGTIVNLLRDLGVDEPTVQLETEGIRQVLDANRQRLKLEKQRTWGGETDPFAAETALAEVCIAHMRNKQPDKLLHDGFSPQILWYKEVGFDTNQSRIVYPIRDIYGTLAGISGGAVLDTQKPKYLVYEGPRKDHRGRLLSSHYGPWFDERYPDYTFSNRNYLWNYERVFSRLFFGKEVDPAIVIVEGFKALLWVLQHGWWNVVALMGSSLSDRQLQLLLKPLTRYILFLDNDDAGRKATLKIGRTLYKIRPGVNVAQYPANTDGAQPDDLTPEALTVAIERAKPYLEYMKESNDGTRRAS